MEIFYSFEEYFILIITPILKNKLNKRQKIIKKIVLLLLLIIKKEKAVEVIIKYKMNEKKNADM